MAADAVEVSMTLRFPRYHRLLYHSCQAKKNGQPLYMMLPPQDVVVAEPLHAVYKFISGHQDKGLYLFTGYET